MLGPLLASGDVHAIVQFKSGKAIVEGGRGMVGSGSGTSQRAHESARISLSQIPVCFRSPANRASKSLISPIRDIG
ncbi:hypothetical protein PoB_001054300 [Plakobranchus ocellatus]|uniref:Uncharacterized protein n=1 Tax=Plakobranchus ocellatus TaxID=259542 RepID=A0AAV3YP42_9GAST|nr:hypothetical protein PoB_001054300 [Plakobranchus ocellatus]